MIARVWHGWATPGEHADAYEAMLKPELLPNLSSKKGFRGSKLLRRDASAEVEFITIIYWDSLDDVKALAGPDYETAIVPEERRQHLVRWDDKATHYDIVSMREPF